MTTNAGSEVSTSISGFADNKEQKSKEKTEKALASFLRPEFINRIDEIIVFRHLNESDFVKIADIMLSKLSAHMNEKGIRMTYSEDVLSYVARKSYSEKYGARNMRRFVERSVEDRIASLIIDNAKTSLLGIHLTVDNDEIQISSI